ncbi:MAG: NAD(P)H-hydrate dehydratase [Candidatus Bathyarchaeia archaeon]
MQGTGLSEGYMTSSDVRRLDLNSEYLGVSTLQLMENAGRAVAAEVASRFKQGSRIIILAGTGRNGGDGMVAARHLASMGYDVSLQLVGSESNIRDRLVSLNWGILKEMSSSVKLQVSSDSEEYQPLEADVLVDSMLGVGLTGSVRQPILGAVKALNRSRGFIISVDVPTGVDSDSGEIRGDAVKAQLTVTFHALKAGFAKAKEYVGEVRVASIGIPPEAELYAGPGDVDLVSGSRPPQSKKGDFGRVLVIGGDETYSGAPALVALAALRAGTDLAYVAAPTRTAQAISSMSPNLITVKLSGEHFNPDNIAQLKPLLERVTAVAVGPGMGLSKESCEGVERLIRILELLRKPTLIDADALKALGVLKKVLPFPAVLTPHAGEFEALAGVKVSAEFEDRVSQVKRLARDVQSVILLKGRVDIVSDGSHVKLNRTGNPGMTVGGTGDVLSGIVASLIAQGCRPFEAAVAGAFINGAAGDFAYREKGFHLLATDLIDQIPRVMNDPMSHRDAKYLGS